MKKSIPPLDIDGAHRRFRELLNPPRPASPLMTLDEFLAKHPETLCVTCCREPAPHLRRPHGKNARGELVAVTVDPVLICASCEHRLVSRSGLEFVPSICEGPCHRFGVPLKSRGTDPENPMMTCDECENDLDELYEEQRRAYYGGLF